MIYISIDPLISNQGGKLNQPQPLKLGDILENWDFFVKRVKILSRKILDAFLKTLRENSDYVGICRYA